MKLWEKRTLERRNKDLSTVLNRSKNPEACRVTARIADGRLETDEQTIMQADLITHFELFVRREMEAGRDPYCVCRTPDAGKSGCIRDGG